MKRFNDSMYRFCKVYNLPYKFINTSLDELENLITNKLGNNKHNNKEFKKFLYYIENLQDFIDKGIGMAICGPVGTAKTTAMTFLSKTIIQYFNTIKEIKQNKKFYCIQATSLFNLATKNGLSENELEMRRTIKELHALWIDDLTKFGQTTNGNELLYLDDIIRYRDLNALPTYYTLQVPLKEVGKTMSIPILDIIKGNCIVLEFIGESLRSV